MSTVSPVAGEPEIKREWPWLSASRAALVRRPLTTALLIIALTTLLRLHGTVDSDVSWQLWIAHQVNGGARLYRDIVEINPPLWFWMALPVDRAATLLHVRADHVLIVAVGCLVALSLAATDRLVRPLETKRRTALLAYLAVILTAMPGMQVGQREQLALLAALPYSALIAARRNGRAVPAWLAVAVAVGAGLGFALKHYFLIVPAALELWLLLGRRKAWQPVRPETATLFAVGLAYGAAVIVWAGAYLTDVVPMVMLAYGATGAVRATDLLQPGIIVGVITLAALAIQLRSGGRSKPAEALGVSALAFGAAYLAQAKGWHYHALPLLGCASAGLACALASSKRVAGPVLLAAPALLLLPLVLSAQLAMREVQPTPDLRNAVAGLRPGESVGFIATDPALAWSITFQKALRYPSRYMGFWMMRAVVDNEMTPRPNPRLAALGRQVVRQTVQDFHCAPPQRIVVARPLPGAADKFDILPFFMRDPQFAELLSHYRPLGRTTLDVYDRFSPLGPPPPHCRTTAV